MKKRLQSLFIFILVVLTSLVSLTLVRADGIGNQHRLKAQVVDQDQHPLYGTRLFLSTGEILKLTESKFSDIDPESTYEFELDEDGQTVIQFVKVENTLDSHIQKSDRDFQPLIVNPAYQGVVWESMDRATQVFKTMISPRKFKQKSQCYQRAHNWVWDLNKNQGINSYKMFLFFTRRYIDAVDYKWWFHVAPMMKVKTAENEISDVVFDPVFSSRPRVSKSWTDIFMENKALCAKVENYSDYRNHQQEQDCYLIEAPMYYYQPRDLANSEVSHTVRNGFINWELEHMLGAYKFWERPSEP
jgi:hypothetical protein